MGTAAALAAVAAVGEAALPKAGAVYEGKATGGAVPPLCAFPPCTDPNHPPRPERGTVRLDVSKSGSTVNFRTPQGCYFNPVPTASHPYPWSYGRIKGLKVSSHGTFSGKRTYRDSTQPNYILDWTIKVSGQFTSSSKAKGTVTYEAKQSGRAGPTPRSCGKYSGGWAATRK